VLFARLYVHKLAFHAGQGKLEHGTSRFIRIRPEPAPMGIDDGPADRQPHPHSAGLRCVESLENSAQFAPDRGPARKSRTATRTPFASVGSVLISTSRGPASTAPIASTAFSTRFRMTCCN